VFPLKPPAEWFNLPEPDEPTPLTFEKSGRVYGHLALWASCHAGLMNGEFAECITPPRSETQYRAFHLGEIEAEDGQAVPVGKVVYATGHAPLTAGLESATKHYDNTGAVGAFVRARDGNHGIWLSGAVRSDLSEEGFRDLRANPPSGDWRMLNRNLELIASLSVPVPGFQTPRSQMAVAASAGVPRVTALILTSTFDEEKEPLALAASAGYIEEKRAIAASIRLPRSRAFIRERALTAATLTSKRRTALPNSAFAVPGERKFPIMDESHARNALARAAGTKYESTVRRAVCKRYPDMGECGN
jgi:hypothetical protein